MRRSIGSANVLKWIVGEGYQDPARAPPPPRHSHVACRQEEAFASIVQGRNQWPQHPTELRPVYEEYIEAMLDLGSRIMSAVFLGLRLSPPHPAEQLVSDPFWIMRAIHYPAKAYTSATGDEDEDDGSGCGAHTDYGFLTIINQDDVPGCLQVQTNDGQWRTAAHVEDALIVNIGDMLSCFTDGVYKSTPHRVASPRHQHRISVPFFFEPNLFASIEGQVYAKHLLAKLNSNFATDD
eukprot:m.159030 g.159030  ORF g.159030 m.159030 type:complete len:237 (-) comp10254_c0_seq11:57-767(-)